MLDLEYTEFHGLGLAAKFCERWLKATGEPDELNSLAEDALLLEDIVQILRGTHDTFQYRIQNEENALQKSKHREIKSHVPAGMSVWKESRIKLFPAKKEFGIHTFERCIFYEEWVAALKNPADATIMEFLLRRPGRIPKAWDPKYRYIFPATRYNYPEQGRYGDCYLCLEQRRFSVRNEWTVGNVDVNGGFVKEEDIMVTVLPLVHK